MIEVVHLFPKLNNELVSLLRGLTPPQWHASTVCKGWSVKDIAAHLLDTAIRRVSGGRDGHFGPPPESIDDQGILPFINSLNSDWVKAYKRVSPAVLISQLEAAQDDFYNYVAAIDLTAPALFPVSWAGEQESQQWFDIAREYTERWHHQQQIRLATGTTSIVTPEFYPAFLETCMRALPFHFRNVIPVHGTSLKIQIVGNAGGIWHLKYQSGLWMFVEDAPESSTTVYIDQNIAWLLFSRGISIQEAQQYWQIQGDRDLGYHVLELKPFII